MTSFFNYSGGALTPAPLFHVCNFVCDMFRNVFLSIDLHRTSVYNQYYILYGIT